ncbi:hypothetical protein JX266_000592 [Neoarthrinium moseri]|nr:hypothetical protein JX266_000592 [Neoarthrinium moseri]
MSSPALLDAVFNHLVLPRKLPGTQDARLLDIQNDLVSRMIRACDCLRNMTNAKFTSTWDDLRESLKLCGMINQGYLDKAKLKVQFRSLEPNTMLILHVVQQNAALLVRHYQTDGVEKVVFECFEVSPTPDEMLATDNALQWDFPGRSAEIPTEIFQTESFQDMLSQFLEQASSEKLQSFAAHVMKAGVPVIESRGTADPALISQMLLSQLEAIGTYHEAPKIRKRVRDDVNINRAEIPWRRHPFWLMLRVASQRQLHTRLGNVDGRSCYKVLISAVLCQFLKECAGTVSPENRLLLCDKLASRLAKLEKDIENTQSTSTTLKDLLSTVGPFFENVLDESSLGLTKACEDYRRSVVRKIAILPRRAMQDELRLTLPNRGGLLWHILKTRPPEAGNRQSFTLPELDGTVAQSARFAKNYVDLAHYESTPDALVQNEMKWAADDSFDDKCSALARQSIALIQRVRNAYESNPEQMSNFLLKVFDLWVKLDEEATRRCPLLLDLHPIFTPELIEALQPSSRSDLARLRRIQEYLWDRVQRCKTLQGTILSSIQADGFASRYFTHNASLEELRVRLEQDSQDLRTRKKAEWRELCEEYDKLTERILGRTCECEFDINGKKIRPVCRKCSYWGARCNLQIAIHEDYLPIDETQRNAMLLELAMPRYLREYRDATWNICMTLAYPSRPMSTQAPEKLIEEFGNVVKKDYVNWIPGRITLASDKKAFIDTHYKWQNVKVDLERVILPNPLNLAYWDKEERQWVHQLDKPLTLQHLCRIQIPSSLASSVLPQVLHPNTTSLGPTSYEIQANQTSCPPQMLMSEFVGLQQLLATRNLRWLVILREMRSPNLDLRNEETATMISQLVKEAGPMKLGEPLLGSMHSVLANDSFCCQLLDFIDGKLEEMRSRHHEGPIMDLMLSLSMQLYELGPRGLVDASAKRIKSIRTITLQWTKSIRSEMQNCKEDRAAEHKARYGLWAALICRRSYYWCVEGTSKIKPGEFSDFIQASLALQWNLVVEPQKLPTVLRNMLVRDARIASKLRTVLQSSLRLSVGGLETAINSIWSSLGQVHERRFTAWEPATTSGRDADNDDGWIVSKATNRVGGFTYDQVIHYNYIEGHLLVNGKPLGKLPEQIREDFYVKTIFGGKYLLTCPSSLAGMSHMLVNSEPNHEIHFGIRDGTVIIRDLTKDGLLEFIPNRIFKGKEHFDLPSSLVDNCIHWLNLNTKRLEVRRESTMWFTKSNDWVLDMTNRQARRGKSSLVDPNSEVGKMVARIFTDFEVPDRITICQPETSSLSVELRHLDLTLRVNARGLLQSLELKVEIDPNQDAGTLYGFSSMIVFRDVENHSKRSIFVSTGELYASRTKFHVRSGRRSADAYLRFDIDEVLGRLTCASEPHLLYNKAHLHAMTSFLLPDPLTGRTGSEEALAILTSSQCQPWEPVSSGAQPILKEIAALSPRRRFYPEDKRCMQTVVWDDRLTATTQHDHYEVVVNNILEKSYKLNAFASSKVIPGHIKPADISSLRAQAQQSKYERENASSQKYASQNDRVYASRDCHTTSSRAKRAFHMTKLLLQEDLVISLTQDLKSIMSSWKTIGGFRATNQKPTFSLSELIEKSISENWGSLLRVFRLSDSNKDRYQLINQLCLLCFGPRGDAEMDMIKAFAAFAWIDEAKTLTLPDADSFVGYKPGEQPDLDTIKSLVTTGYPEYVEKEGHSKINRAASNREHREKMEVEGLRLTIFLLNQWPKEELTLDGFESSLMNIQDALQSVSVEWERLQKNKNLHQFLIDAQIVLQNVSVDQEPVYPTLSAFKSPVFTWHHESTHQPPFSAIFSRKPGVPTSLMQRLQDVQGSREIAKSLASSAEKRRIIGPNNLPKEVAELGRLLETFKSACNDNPSRTEYVDDLKTSLIALQGSSALAVEGQSPDLKESVIEQGIIDCKAQVSTILGIIQETLSMDTQQYKWLGKSRLWYSVTPITLLQQLRSTRREDIHDDWKKSLVAFGLCIAGLQRVLRIKDAKLQGNRQRITEELQNIGHQNWDPSKISD